MGSPCPPHWSFAARAAYFGDRMCAFCDHRNPPGAKFCNACASPLHLKPCKECDAVNDEAATNCYKCGAAAPVLFGTHPTAGLRAADSALPGATPSDPTAAGVKQPLFAASGLRARRGLLRPGQFLVAAVATMLVVVAYDAYRVNGGKRDVVEVASQTRAAAENNMTTAIPAVPAAMESKSLEPDRAVALEAPIPATDAEVPKRATVRQRPAAVRPKMGASAHPRAAPVPAVKRASAGQRPPGARRAPVGAASPAVAQGPAAAKVVRRVAQTSKAPRPNRWQVMHVSLARCGGDLIAHFVCDQRVRRHFCEGHWGQTAECASGVVNEHGQ